MITTRKIKAWAKEERQASAEYKKFGFKNISRDEARHSKFFSKMLKGRKQ